MHEAALKADEDPDKLSFLARRAGYAPQTAFFQRYSPCGVDRFP